MFGSFFKTFYYLVAFVVVMVILISCFFIPTFANGNLQFQINQGDIVISPSGFAWPIPGYTTITSYYGKRTSPTQGASSFHKGLDIGAPEGTILIAAVDGQITYTGFLGGGGYTITLSKDDMKITYCHVSPNFLVNVGDNITRGQVIGMVGPKYVYGIKGNNYTDDQGRPTNGATTGCHLHFGIRLDDKYVNPLDYY